MKLTDIVLRNLRPPEQGQTTYRDENLRGFGVRVSHGGTKTVVVVHGVNRERTTSGRYPVLTLTDVLERIVSGRTKRNDLATLPPWHWNADRPQPAGGTG